MREAISDKYLIAQLEDAIHSMATYYTYGGIDGYDLNKDLCEWLDVMQSALRKLDPNNSALQLSRYPD